MKRTSLIAILFVIACFCVVFQVSALDRVSEAAKMKPSVVMNLWKGTAPGEKEGIGEEKTEFGNETPPVSRTSNVSVPTLSLYPSKITFKSETGSETDSGKPCVIIYPGGGYHILAANLEGTEIAHWFNSFGVDAVICKYRVPRRPGVAKHTPPLQDAQRTVRLVRQNAKDWGIDPNKIGVLGFSAGGHLCVLAATAFEAKTYEPIDAADELSCRPDFALPIYPAYLLGEDGKTNNKADTPFAQEIKFTKQTPPFFISITDDDPVGSMGAARTYIALKELGVPCELHIFLKGGHGYGLRHERGRQAAWDELAETWMKSFL